MRSNPGRIDGGTHEGADADPPGGDAAPPGGGDATAWLAAIVESSDDAIVGKTLSGIVTSWNSAARRLFGYSAEEMIGRSITHIAVPGREAEMLRILERIRQGERVEHHETVRRRKDGLLIEVSLTVSPIRDGTGRIIGASKIARDISERKRAEAALRESEARFRQLADRLPVLVWYADRNGRIGFFGQRWYDYTGFAEADSLGFGWRRVIHPDDWGAIVSAWVEARSQGRTYEAEFRCRGQDGDYHWFLTRAEPLHDEAGRLTGWFGTSTDIHDRKRAEEHQRLIMAELDHRVKNILAAVQSIANRTLPPSAAVKDFGGRLAALGKTHELLAAHRWQGAGLDEIVAAELAPFLVAPHAERIAISGESILLVPRAAQTLAMVLHELATNAAKYGALAVAAGRLRVTWGLNGAGQLRLEWQESGGPPVSPPERRGFGTVMIERGVSFELEGQAEVEFLERGLRCILLLPVAGVVADTQPGSLAIPNVEWPEA